MHIRFQFAGIRVSSERMQVGHHEVTFIFILHANIIPDGAKIIAFVEQLQALDTEGELPVLQMSTNTDVLREDVIQKTLSREEALKNAPVTDGVFFIVPKVISK